MKKKSKEGQAFNRKNRNLKATDPDELTISQRTSAYKEQNGEKCMFCWRPQLQGEDVNIESGQASQNITCAACGATWTDVYVLTNAVNISKEGN
jgi:DNA-directed RNA polymerase subunit RPC12/RpoP